MQNTRCQQAAAEIREHPYSCAAEQVELVSRLDVAVETGKATLHGCRQRGHNTTAGANKRLRLQQVRVSKREGLITRHLNVILHKNHSLAGRIADLRNTVLRDREHCNNLLHRHTTLVEAAAQYTNSVLLETQTKSVCRSIKQNLDSTKSSQVSSTGGSRAQPRKQFNFDGVLYFVWLFTLLPVKMEHETWKERCRTTVLPSEPLESDCVLCM